ncbi:MAG: outer membrane protein assembly factor BamD [Bdellovibrio sp.]|nr:MAG: outer membrane protein assembly factor BamD [Bdellovibrio sp.]
MRCNGSKRILSLGTLFPFLLSLVLVACSAEEKKSDTPEGAFAIAQEFDQNERYEEAIRRYQEVKNKYPYSKFAVQAELAIADAYFKEESYPEAQVSYQTFKELHPKHANIDYVTYRLAMSFYNQLPETIDRDLSLSQNAMTYFDELVAHYPNSPHVAEAKEKKIDCLKKLAGKEEYIGDFYYIRGKYDSALGRYEQLLKLYANLGFDAKALSRAAICAGRTGELERARGFLGRLKKEFPDSSELAEAQREVH